MFNEKEKHEFTSEDFRFTAKSTVLYAINLNWSDNGEIQVKSLAEKTIEHVSLLGCDDTLQWSMADDGLVIQAPENRPSDYAYSYKITFSQ